MDVRRPFPRARERCNLSEKDASNVVRDARSVSRFRTKSMKILAVLLLAAASVTALAVFTSRAHAPRHSDLAARRNPVLVELFTSEGCSSCPPADALLQKLDSSQPVDGADLIVLSEHVDYWDSEAWKDRYSSHAYTERQEAYATRLGLNTVYTPQMVIDGRIELVGSEEPQVLRALGSAARVEKIAMALSSVRPEGSDTLALHLVVSPLPGSAASESANVLVALARESAVSLVGGGENSGATLRHIAILRSLTRVGGISKSAGLSQDFKLKLDGENPRDLRIVAIVQDAPIGRVWGAASARLPSDR